MSRSLVDRSMPAWCTKANVPADQERDPGRDRDVHRLPVEGARRGFDQRVGGRERHPALLLEGRPSYTAPAGGGVPGITAPVGPPRVLIRGRCPRSPGVVRIAALGDIHLGRAGYGPPVQTIFTDVAERADVLALCGDLTDRGEPEEGRRLAKALAGARHADRRGAGQPRLRVGQGARGRAHPVRRGDAGARRRAPSRSRRRVRRGQGVRRRVRPPGARPLGRGDHQAVRAGGGGRGAQAGDGAGRLAHRAADRAAALLADRGHGRGRAAGDLSLPRLQPAGGAAHPLSGGCGVPRPRAPRRAGGPDRAACRSTTCRINLLQRLDPGRPARSAMPGAAAVRRRATAPT